MMVKIVSFQIWHFEGMLNYNLPYVSIWLQTFPPQQMETKNKLPKNKNVKKNS